MKKRILKYWAIPILSIFVLGSCKKKDEFINPYSEYKTKPLYDVPSFATVSSSNFAYLQETIFKPTCASAGCHDGAFAPDFRTISSSYNTTVFHPVLTNDPLLTFTYRVKPGDATLSLMHERLITALPNTSGIMAPDYVGSWQINKQAKINAIKKWINDGALDMYGNAPALGNPNPFIEGFQVFPAGNTTSNYNRAPGAGITPFVIQKANVDLWFSISDDTTPATSLTVNEVKVSENMYDFTTVTPGVANISGTLTANDFNNNLVTFTHKYTFDASGYASGTILYVRIYVQDANHSLPLETPNEGTAKQVLYLFTMYVS